jgi:hypothetical protein
MSSPSATCVSTQVVNFLIARGRVQTGWSEYIEKLNLQRRALFGNIETIQDQSCREYLKSCDEEMKYPEASVFLDMLMKGADGQEKNWFFLGGGFKSPIVNEWIEFVKFYHENNLYVVEIGLALKQCIIGISNTSREISEKRLQLVEIGERIKQNQILIEKSRVDLKNLRETYGIFDDDMEGLGFYFDQKNEELRKCISESISKLENTTRDYSERFGVTLDGNMEHDRLFFEELLFYHKSSQGEPSTELMSRISSVISMMLEYLSFDKHEMLKKAISELSALDSTVNRNKTEAKLIGREASTRLSIQEAEDELKGLRLKRVELSKIVKSELDRIFPNIRIELVDG